MTERIKHQGKTWLVKHRQEKAIFSAESKDEAGNPKSEFVVTDWLNPNEISKKQKHLEGKYQRVSKHWSWEVCHLFRETIGKNDNAKQIEQTTLQREFNGKEWNVANPLDVAKQLGEEKWTTQAKVIAWALVAVIAAVVYYLIRG